MSISAVQMPTHAASNIFNSDGESPIFGDDQVSETVSEPKSKPDICVVIPVNNQPDVVLDNTQDLEPVLFHADPEFNRYYGSVFLHDSQIVNVYDFDPKDKIVGMFKLSGGIINYGVEATVWLCEGGSLPNQLATMFLKYMTNVDVSSVVFGSAYVSFSLPTELPTHLIEMPSGFAVLLEFLRKQIHVDQNETSVSVKMKDEDLLFNIIDCLNTQSDF